MDGWSDLPPEVVAASEVAMADDVAWVRAVEVKSAVDSARGPPTPWGGVATSHDVAQACD